MKRLVLKFTKSLNSNGKTMDVRASQCPTVLHQAIVPLQKSEAIQTGEMTPTCLQAVNTHFNSSKLNMKSADRLNASEKHHKSHPTRTKLGTTTTTGNESCHTSASPLMLQTPSLKLKIMLHFLNNFHALKTTPSCSTRSPS